MNAERQRLRKAAARQKPWRKWGPYLSERQWATVRKILIVGVCMAVLCGGVILLITGQLNSQSAKATKTDPLAQFNVERLTVLRDEIRTGGPGKDGIPTLTKPKAIATKGAKYRADERIVVVTIGKETRGYPLAILNWHEAVNDVIGGTPIAVVYCPLCDSVSIVDRRMDDATLEFGISGLLHNSNVLLYDRKSNALWSQIGLQAISGPHAGKSLKHLPWRLTTFSEFAKQFPKATVISTETGHRRDYTRNPYAAYFRTDQLMFPVSRRDNRLKPKTAVVGVKIGDTTRAYPVDTILQAKDGKIVDKVGESRIVLQADQNTVAVVEVPDNAMVVHTFWFAWAAFHPGTSIYGQTPTTQEAHDQATTGSRI